MKKRLIGSDILDAVDSVRSETGVSKEIVFDAIKTAFEEGARKKYGSNSDIVAEINKSTGEIRTYRIITVVEDVNDRSREITLEQAKRYKTDAILGDVVKEDLPPVHFDRIIAQRMASIITGEIKNAEKENEYNLYVERIGEVVTGIVKKVSQYEILVWIGGKTEATMNIRDMLPNERYNLGDKVVACIQKIERDNINPQIILSRSSNEFLVSILKREIPECEDGIVEVVSVAREAGFRSKIAVTSSDSRLDAVGSCIGPRGSRIKAIMEELKGEKIDILEYNEDPTVLIERSLSPSKIQNVSLNERTNKIEVIVDDENFSLAVGRRGQNVRLASKLSGYKIDIILASKRQEESSRRFNEASVKIANALNLDETAAQVLVASGFYYVQELANATLESISNIEGFDEEVAKIIKDRANEYVEHLKKEHDTTIKNLGIDQEVLELPILTKEMVIKLGENNIKSISDIADLSSDELVEILGEELITEEEAGSVVMISRKYIYDI